MKADCWHYPGGHHGPGTSIAAYNARLPAILAATLAQPEARAFSLEQIEETFNITTGQYITLQKGDDDVVLASIIPLYCSGGSHDGPGSVLYVVDHSGNFWEIGRPRRTLDLQWMGDRWVGTVDVASTVYAPPDVPEIWVIARKDGAWTLADKLLSADFINSLSLSFQDGYHVLIANLTSHYGQPPCERIRQMPAYYNTWYDSTYVYAWSLDHYVLVHVDPPAPATVVFMLQGTPAPDLSNVHPTPYYDPHTNSLLAYWVHDWQPMCQ